MSKPGDNDYLWDRRGPADPDVARLEELMSPLGHTAPLDELRLRRRRARWPWFVASAIVAAAAALVVWSQWPGDPTKPEGVAHACGADASGFAFRAEGGNVACGGAKVPGGVLPVGGVLDTGAHEAELAIADIGSARLGARTRVRLDKTSPERHELYLEHGRMHARVIAPPRLFAVGTPSAHVTDLGCEYTLEIDETGAGSITVQTGRVELETGKGVLVQVPAGARAKLLAGRRASLPVGDTAAPQLVAAVDEYDRGMAGAVERILELATPADAITVAHLAKLAPPAQKRAVLERLMALFPAPRGMTVDEALADDAMFDVVWFDEVVFQHGAP